MFGRPISHLIGCHPQENRKRQDKDDGRYNKYSDHKTAGYRPFGVNHLH